ncbi:hypothetical protein A2U01_0111496, partial [Trifolium medium]|nr:hypothetical protein [Trifolium medium]
ARNASSLYCLLYAATAYNDDYVAVEKHTISNRSEFTSLCCVSAVDYD